MTDDVDPGFGAAWSASRRRAPEGQLSEWLEFALAACDAADATARGVVIVDCTQCLRGTVDLHAYATGTALLHAGVIGGADMTVEAALAKLVYLLSTMRSPDHARDLMGQSLCGELTS